MKYVREKKNNKIIILKLRVLFQATTTIKFESSNNNLNKTVAVMAVSSFNFVILIFLLLLLLDSMHGNLDAYINKGKRRRKYKKKK